MALDENTLTQAMETSLAALWHGKGRGILPITGKEDREILFRAIARAVIEHLRSNAEVVLTDPRHDHKHMVTCSVDVKNTDEAGNWVNHDHRATCSVMIEDHKHTQTGKIN